MQKKIISQKQGGTEKKPGMGPRREHLQQRKKKSVVTLPNSKKKLKNGVEDYFKQL